MKLSVQIVETETPRLRILENKIRVPFSLSVYGIHMPGLASTRCLRQRFMLQLAFLSCNGIFAENVERCTCDYFRRKYLRSTTRHFFSCMPDGVAVHSYSVMAKNMNIYFTVRIKHETQISMT